MTRILRAVAAGLPHYPTQRGNPRQETFLCDDDYSAYIPSSWGSGAQVWGGDAGVLRDAKSRPSHRGAGIRRKPCVGEEDRELRRHERPGRPPGSPGFVERLESALRRTLRRRKPGPRGKRAPNSMVSSEFGYAIGVAAAPANQRNPCSGRRRAFAYEILTVVRFIMKSPEVAERRSAKNYRVVFHLDEGNRSRVKMALANVENLIADLGQDKVEVALVANGEGVIALLEIPGLYKQEIEKLAAKGVRFFACAHSLSVMGLGEDALLDLVEVVPAGVSELTRRQAEGWAYIRP
jgi:intracellular sulfur oxidation DsrE/DsrF family protein